MEISILQTSKLGLLLQLFNQINKYTHVRDKKTQKPAKLIGQNRHIDTTPKFMVCRRSKNPCEKLYQPPTQPQIPNLWWSQKVRDHKTATGKKSFGQFQIWLLTVSQLITHYCSIKNQLYVFERKNLTFFFYGNETKK